MVDRILKGLRRTAPTISLLDLFRIPLVNRLRAGDTIIPPLSDWRGRQESDKVGTGTGLLGELRPLPDWRARNKYPAASRHSVLVLPVNRRDVLRSGPARATRTDAASCLPVLCPGPGPMLSSSPPTVWTGIGQSPSHTVGTPATP